VDGTPQTGNYWIFANSVNEGYLYDKEGLIDRLGERLYKSTLAKTDTKRDLVLMAQNMLKEFLKNHTRCQTTVAFHPALRIGQTVRVIDAVNNIDRNYFVESISKRGYSKSLTMGYYP